MECLWSGRQPWYVYGILKSTLHDHVSRKLCLGAGVGHPQHLPDEEEEELVRWLEDCVCEYTYVHTYVFLSWKGGNMFSWAWRYDTNKYVRILSGFRISF